MDAAFNAELERRTKEVQEVIEGTFRSYLQRKDHAYVHTMIEAMDYSFLAGGKRLRPLMMRETYRLFQGGTGFVPSELAAFMTALEMIHTYSLVHDDLPAMDNDEYRRGKFTTWKVYGDGMAVLAGDALLNAAYEIAFETIQSGAVGIQGGAMEIQSGAVDAAGDADLQRLARIAKCGSLLSGKAGLDGMLGGQVADVEAEKKSLSIDMEKILFIHERKTAALIETAMGIGACLAGADDAHQEAVLRIARKVGVAFQIQDDILDVIGDSKDLGKSVGSDAKSGKETYVTLQGLEASKAEVERLSKEAVEELKSLPGDAQFLEQLILHLIYRKK